MCHPIQDKHTGCHYTSLCRRPNHTPDKEVITDKATVDAFLAKIKSLPIYRHADSYARVSISNFHAMMYLCRQ